MSRTEAALYILFWVCSAVSVIFYLRAMRLFGLTNQAIEETDYDVADDLHERATLLHENGVQFGAAGLFFLIAALVVV